MLKRDEGLQTVVGSVRCALLVLAASAWHAPVLAQDGDDGAELGALSLATEPFVHEASSTRAGNAEPRPAPRVEECGADSLAGSQVVILGDSYFHLSGDIKRELFRLARKAGSLHPAARYLDYSLSGASLNGFPNIPAQYGFARFFHQDLRVVLMTGGGNDVLMNNRPCLRLERPDLDARCQNVVARAVETLEDLYERMARDGIEDIVYFFYPHLPGGGLGGVRPNAILDYAYPFVRSTCERQTGVRCHFIDTRPWFEGHPEYIRTDGIHPSAQGSIVIARTIWQTMVQQCIAQ